MTREELNTLVLRDRGMYDRVDYCKPISGRYVCAIVELTLISMNQEYEVDLIDRETNSILKTIHISVPFVTYINKDIDNIKAIKVQKISEAVEELTRHVAQLEIEKWLD